MRNVDEKRRLVARNIDEYNSILFLLGNLTGSALVRGDQILQATATATRKELEKILYGCQQQVATLREEYGVRLSPDEAIAIYSETRADVPEGDNDPLSRAFFAKGHLQRWIRAYGKIMPAFDRLPIHARIALAIPPQTATHEIFLPEAILFEEMAMLFNESIRAQAEIGSAIDPYRMKRFRSFLHACHTTTFHFIEAYLSGIAVDFAHRKAGQISDRDFGLLTEWDLEKKRTKYVSFRDRLIQIPRILAGLQHPPIDESNEPGIVILLAEGKAFRDAIVHSSPLPPLNEVLNKRGQLESLATGVAEKKMRKEDYLAGCDMEPLTRIVDAAIDVVGRIDRLIDGHMTRLGYLHCRDSTGLFPPEAFK